MKLTKQQIKQIIKEELEQIVSEQEEIEEQQSKDQSLMKAAEEAADSPELDRVFAKLDSDPKVQQLLAKLKASGQMDEAEGAFGMGDDSPAPLTATATMFFGYPSAMLFLESAGGKLLLAKVAAVMGMPGLVGLGVAGIGFLAPIAIGYILDVMANKAIKGNK